MNFEIHLHSNYSDGLNTVEGMAKHVKKVGLDGFALTDHNTTAGHKKAQEAAKKEKLVFIPGMEINCAEGHMTVFGKNVSGIKQWKGMPLEEALENTHKQGCIAIAVHPYDFLRKGCMCSLSKKLPFDYIEVWNARALLPFFNSLARRAAIESKKPMAAGSDAHTLYEIGHGAIKMDSLEDLYRGRATISKTELIGLYLHVLEKIKRFQLKCSTQR